MHVDSVKWLCAIGITLTLNAAVRAAEEPKAPAAPTPNLAAPALPATPVMKLIAPTSVVAVVEGVELRQADVNARLDRILAMAGGRVPADKITEFRAQVGRKVLDELVLQTLLLHTADKAKITVTKDDIEKAIKEMPLPPGQTLETALAAQGMNRADFDKEINTGLKIQKLIEKQVASLPAVNDEQIKKFYDENKERLTEPETVTARHLLVKFPENADAKAKATAKEKAEGLRKQLAGGADFAKLVKENSDDPGSKDTGGEYTFPRGQMVKAFEEAAFGQKLNEIGPLVETQFGYHIIQTLAKHEAKTAKLEDVKADVRKHLENQAKGTAVQKYIEELRAKADVKIPSQP